MDDWSARSRAEVEFRIACGPQTMGKTATDSSGSNASWTVPGRVAFGVVGASASCVLTIVPAS